MAQVTKFSRGDIAEVCREMGPEVGPLPASIRGDQLLWSIAGNESSYGANCAPRHEPAFDVGGPYASDARQKALLEKFGSAGARSYGPLQVMLVNAPDGYAPETFNDLRAAFRAGVYALNNLLKRFQPQTVEVIGYCYNGGHPLKPVPGAQAYGARLAQRYATVPLPVVGAEVAAGSK